MTTATRKRRQASSRQSPEFPVLVKCANLGWHTLRATLKGYREAVSTE